MTTTESSDSRLDKWLWHARLVKSRTLASRLVTEGKVRVNREKVTKPAYSIKPGDVITAAIHARIRVLRVLHLGARRGPASEAQALYEDLSPPMHGEPARRRRSFDTRTRRTCENGARAGRSNASDASLTPCAAAARRMGIRKRPDNK